MKPLSIFDPNSDRVDRGGSWYDSLQFARVANRGRWPPRTRYSNLGFRSCWTIR